METKTSNATRSIEQFSGISSRNTNGCIWRSASSGTCCSSGGSVLFLFEGQAQTYGIWAFVVGSFLTLVGSIGEAVVKSTQDGS